MVRELTEHFSLRTGVRDLERTILGAATATRGTSAESLPTSLAVLLTKIGCQRIISEREDLRTRLIDAEDGIDWDNLSSDGRRAATAAEQPLANWQGQ